MNHYETAVVGERSLSSVSLRHLERASWAVLVSQVAEQGLTRPTACAVTELDAQDRLTGPQRALERARITREDERKIKREARAETGRLADLDARAADLVGDDGPEN